MSNQLTYCIANVCFLAAQGHDWVTHFDSSQSYENLVVVKGAKNIPEDLAEIISAMDEDELDALSADLEELKA